MPASASIRCRCWEEGKTTPPPVPVYLDADVDSLSCRFNGSLKEIDRAQSLFSEWEETCCEHKRMEAFFAEFSRTPLAGFFAALDKFDPRRKLSLRRAAPRDDRPVPPEVCASALMELDMIEQETDLGDRWAVVNAESGAPVYTHVCEDWDHLSGFTLHTNRLSWGMYVGARVRETIGEFVLAVGEAGLTIRVQPWKHSRTRSRVPDRMLLRTIDFRQIVDAKHLIFVDVPSGARVRLPNARARNLPFQVPCYADHPEPSDIRFLVVRRTIGASDFKYIIQDLRTAFEASVRIGNPIIWST